MAPSKKNTAVRHGDGGNSEATLSQDDLDWLSSLFEPELVSFSLKVRLESFFVCSFCLACAVRTLLQDFLISLKELVIRRAKNAGCTGLANKFDLRMLRALGIVLLEHFKSHAESASLPSNFAETSSLLRDYNSATPHFEKNADFVIVSEDAKELNFVTPRRKRMWEGLREERASRSKKENSKKTRVTFGSSLWSKGMAFLHSTPLCWFVKWNLVFSVIVMLS